MAQLITVRLSKSDHQPLGFRLQGGKDFGTPLVVQKVNGGSAAERAGLQAGDALIRVNSTDVYALRHQEAQDAIRAAGPGLELTVQRGGGTWRPSVTPTGSLPRPGSRPLGAAPTPVTNTSLKATPQPSRAFGSGHNSVAKPFGYMNGTDSVKSVVNKQYNTPVNMYSDKTIAETLSAQTEVLAGGVLGVNFKKNEKTYDAEKSAVFKVLQEEQNDPEPEVSSGAPAPAAAVTGLRHVAAPVTRPDAPLNTGGLPPGQNICEECERLITGVFVRIKDKNLHVECFKCATCGTSLKNQGYYNLNGKLYCDIHAKLIARQNPPATNLEPVTVPPGGRIPTNSYSTPLPPLATNNYTNGSSSLFSPSSNLSGPKPFGSSLGSTYSPSLSPRSAPMSPARPVTAPAPAPAPPAMSAPAPFAPTQTVKSIVWPPPSNPEDETQINYTNKTSSIEHNTSSAMNAMHKTNSVPSIQDVTNELNSGEKVISSCQQSAKSISILTNTAANMSAETSQKSELVKQNVVSQVLNETTYAERSFSTQNTSEKNLLAIHQTSNYPSIQNQEKSEYFNQSLQSAVESKYIAEKKSSSLQFASQFETKVEKNGPKEGCYTPDINRTIDKIDQQATNFKNISEKDDSQTLNNDNVSSSLINSIPDAPDKSHASLPTPASLPSPKQHFQNKIQEETPKNMNKTPSQLSPMFVQQIKRGITPIPPIKVYTPPEKKEEQIPMPPETEPYIPPDFKIIIEPKIPREQTSSPMVEALTTAPERPFTPVKTPTIERGSLKDALTIAPERSFSPISLNTQHLSLSNNTSTSTVNFQCTSSEIVRPIATQTSSQVTNQLKNDFSNLQNTSELQSSSGTSAFKPVNRQVFPPAEPEDFCKLSSFPPISTELRTSFLQNKHNKSDSQKVQQSITTSSTEDNQYFSSVKSAQSYFEHLEQKETLSSTAKRSKSGLHKADDIPAYQKHFELLPSQRGITPELCNAPAIPQKPVTPTEDAPPKSRDVSQERQIMASTISKVATNPKPNKNIPQQQTVIQFHKDTPISMTFQPVADEQLLRASPIRSRPSTPSLINKPAPIIPHYQMNLVAVEHLAPETHMFEPSSPEVSRSPTPKLRSRSPAAGPPPNPLKAQAPRIKETTPQHHGTHSLLTQATSNLRKEHESSQKGFQSNMQVFNAPGVRSCAQDQNSMIKEQQQRNSSFECATSKCTKGDIKIKEDSAINLNYGQREVHFQNTAEYGDTTVQTTRKTFEEFENKQSAKLIEIQREGFPTSGYQHSEPNPFSSSTNTKTVFPPPVMSVTASQVPSSVNEINNNAITACRNVEAYQPNPLNSGANQGPVCDPTPSTGSSVGAAARGKTFGVSSAPKRGRGILNKAALPGSRVPLCASCNGNIRGPFITALGRIWCPEHFICVNATCRRPLQDIGFVEENGQLYCEFCFEQYIAPACDKCHAKIKGDCLNAIGKHFHPECFNCVYCGKLFGNNPFFLEDGLPYCEADWNELFTTKCFACGFPVEAGDRWVEALNNNYHSQCFNCTVCKKNLEGQSFFAKGGRPFCKTHAR